MNVFEEAKIIVDSVKKAQPFNNEIIIKIGVDKDTFEKSYDVQVVYGEIGDDDYMVEGVEMTKNINTLNTVLRELLNQDYFISFEVETF